MIQPYSVFFYAIFFFICLISREKCRFGYEQNPSVPYICLGKSTKLFQNQMLQSLPSGVYRMSLFWFIVFSAHLVLASSLVEFQGMYFNGLLIIQFLTLLFISYNLVPFSVQRLVFYFIFLKFTRILHLPVILKLKKAI